jgi:hypothetical protein
MRCGRLREDLPGWPSNRLRSASPRRLLSCGQSCPPKAAEVSPVPLKETSVSDSLFTNNNQGTNGGFGRAAVLFVASEHVANGVAQREVWLKIRVVEHIANTVQVASRENSVLWAAHMQPSSFTRNEEAG